jgi:hypothetical protein
MPEIYLGDNSLSGDISLSPTKGEGRLVRALSPTITYCLFSGRENRFYQIRYSRNKEDINNKAGQIRVVFLLLKLELLFVRLVGIIYLLEAWRYIVPLVLIENK